MEINLERIEPFLQVALVLIGAFLAASVISIVVWTARDIRSRSRDIFVQLLSVLLVLVFNLPGLLLYFILRPRETLADSYERLLEEEALLQELEGRQACPYCHLRVEDDFLFCPGCHAQLRKTCAYCGRLMHLRWELCPYCGHEEGEAMPEAQAVPLPVGIEEAPMISTAVDEMVVEPVMAPAPTAFSDQPSALADEETLEAYALQGSAPDAGTPAEEVPGALSDQPSFVVDEEIVAAREFQPSAEAGERPPTEDMPAAVGEQLSAFVDEETMEGELLDSPTEDGGTMASEATEPPPFDEIAGSTTSESTDRVSG